MEMFWLVTLLFGLGLFVLLYLLLSVVVDGIGGLLARRKRRGLARLVSRSQCAAPFDRVSTGSTCQLRATPFDGLRAAPTRQAENRYRATQEDLLGLERIPWVHIYAFSMLTGLGLYLFTQQLLVLLLAVIPFAVRLWLANYRKRQLDTELLAFLMDLRISLPLQGSLLRALQELARQGKTRPAGIVSRYLEGGFQGDGLELLDRLAQDTTITHLRDLVAWTRAAAEGTMKVDAPLEHALTRLRGEMYTAARENMQRIPTRLTVLVLPALLGPTIVVLVYPMVARLLAAMGSMSWAGGY